MAQLNSLLVTGDARFLNPIKGVAATLQGTCSTAQGTAQKEVTVINNTAFSDNDLAPGVNISVKFTNSNTHGTPTLKVGTATAKGIMRYGTTKPGGLPNNSWHAGAVVLFTYDGTYWIMNDNNDGLEQSLTSSNWNLPLLMSYTDNTDATTSIVNKSYRNNNIQGNPSTGQINCSSLTASGNIQGDLVIGGSTGITTTGPITANQLKTTYESDGTRYYDSVADVGSDGSITLYDPLKSAVGVVKQTELDVSQETNWREVLLSGSTADYTTKNEETTKSQHLRFVDVPTTTQLNITGNLNKPAAMQILLKSGSTSGFANFEVGIQSGAKVVHTMTPSEYNVNLQKFGVNNDQYETLYTIDKNTLAIGFGTILKSALCIKDLLWENQNPTSSFAAQTVSIATLADYSEVVIDYILEAVNYKNIMTSYVPIGTSGYLNANLSVNYGRQVSVTTTGVQFGRGYYYTSYGSTSDYTVNQYLVPYRIWGWNPPHLVS